MEDLWAVETLPSEHFVSETWISLSHLDFVVSVTLGGFGILDFFFVGDTHFARQLIDIIPDGSITGKSYCHPFTMC